MIEQRQGNSNTWLPGRTSQRHIVQEVLLQPLPQPYLRCPSPEEARKVMQEIHDGDCGNHAGGCSLAHKVINQRYYWPKIFDDAKDYVRKCS